MTLIDKITQEKTKIIIIIYQEKVTLTFKLTENRNTERQRTFHIYLSGTEQKMRNGSLMH